MTKYVTNSQSRSLRRSAKSDSFRTGLSSNPVVSFIFHFQVRFTSLEEGIAGVDVIYMTRVQKERFSDMADYERVKDTFILKPHHLPEGAEADDILRKLLSCPRGVVAYEHCSCPGTVSSSVVIP